jgi:hypothetical protein
MSPSSVTLVSIWFSDATPGMFDETTRVGGITLDREGDVTEQVSAIADLLMRKLADTRVSHSG